MSSVSVNNEVSINFEDSEKETLEKAYEILKELRHDLFIQDDDSDVYWNIDGTLSGLRDVLSDAGIFVNY